MFNGYHQTCSPISKVKLTKTCITQKIPRGKEKGVAEREEQRETLKIPLVTEDKAE